MLSSYLLTADTPYGYDNDTTVMNILCRNEQGCVE